MVEVKQEKLKINMEGLSQTEAEDIKDTIGKIVKAFGGKMSAILRRKCDFCGKILNEGDKYITIDEHNDMCLDCSKKRKSEVKKW